MSETLLPIFRLYREGRCTNAATHSYQTFERHSTFEENFCVAYLRSLEVEIDSSASRVSCRANSKPREKI